MSQDVDLYDDLPLVNFEESISKIEGDRQYFKDQLTEKEKALEAIQEQIKRLEKEKTVLEQNISSLYKSAVGEIKRKDKVIEELRREKEDIIFRRQHKITSDNSSNGTNANMCSVCCKQLPDFERQHTLKPENIDPEISSLRNLSHGESNKLLTKNSVRSNSLKRECLVSFDKNNSNINEDTQKLNLNLKRYSDIDAVSQGCNISSSWDPRNYEDERIKIDFSHKGKREKKSISRDYYDEKHSSSRSRHHSPSNKYKSSRSRYKEHERDTFLDYDDYKKKINTCRSIRKEKEYKHLSRDGELVRSQSFKTSELSRRHFYSPTKRNSNYTSANNGKHLRSQSDNVRIASQLKSKYSKVTRSPVKRQIIKQLDPNSVIEKSVSSDNIENLNSNKNLGSISSNNILTNSEKIVEEAEKREKQLLPMRQDAPNPLNMELCSSREVPSSLSIAPSKIFNSFHNPAVIKEDKFSHCAFNEQCEFKRQKQRMFKKLVVNDKQTLTSLDGKEETSNCITKNVKIVKGDLSFSKETFCPGNEDLHASNINKKRNYPTESPLNQTAGIISQRILSECVQDINNPNKKGKLDFVCDEMNANNSTKTSNVVSASRDNYNLLLSNEGSEKLEGIDTKRNESSVVKLGHVDSVTCSKEIAHSNVLPIPIVSKRKRRVPNFQDNVVQVLSQIE